MKPLVLRNVPLNSQVHTFVTQYFNVISTDELTENNAQEIEVLLSSGVGKAPQSLLEKLPNLKLIDVFGVGYDGVDLEYCKKHNIAICNTPDVLTDDVADTALSLILALSRNIVAAHNYITHDEWEKGNIKFPLGSSVTGKKIGIVGLGRIGSAIAQRARAFNMEIYYYARYDKNNDYIYVDNLLELADKVDYLVISLAANPENNGIIDLDILKALGPTSFLINIARGSLVNEPDLIYALENKLIYGAGLDVFSNEPNVSESLKRMPNVVLTPHIGSATIETREKMAEIVIKNLQSFMENRPYITRVAL